jgi:signal transduction histidine kinase
MSRGNSISRKLLFVVLATTGSALVITGAAMGFYDLHTFRQRFVDDLAAQADILGRAAAPALDFADPNSAQEYVELLEAKPSIIGAAIYTAAGGLFATYAAIEDVEFPPLPEPDGQRIQDNEVAVFKRIVSNDEILGTVYIRAEHGLADRLLGYLGIIGMVMAFSLFAALLMSRWLQRAITQPIFEITSVARNVVEQRDFSVRAPKTTDDEIGLLVDAFNGMLGEIGSRTATLESSNRQLEQAEQRLRELNTELEERVAARTAELEAANKDLEGFSYSVSHDLRAPIRAIQGFCTLFKGDHGDQLDAEAQRKLGIIASEAARMGALIDDLLAFSRLGRKAIRPTQLDMTALAKSVVKRLLNGNEETKYDLRISSMPSAVGDQALMEQVWTNLLSNAIKFSSHKENSVIEVGGISDEREYVYFVRDNGAGFDPRHCARLFGVFQRLHHDSEFPGTGVGLALVQKIVSRHGGRVWGDGKLGEGATFHFTLPKEMPDGRV